MADKGTTSVMMSKESKINEGLALLNEKNNYQPLTQPMVETTTRKVTQLIKSLLQEGHIDDMTAKWLSLTPNPPRIPIFYTLTKIHKPTPVGRPNIRVRWPHGANICTCRSTHSANSTETRLVPKRYDRLPEFY